MTDQAKRSSNALDPLLCEAGSVLFALMQVPLASVARADGPAARGETMMGVVGFANEQMSGALCVVASDRVAAALRPPELDEAPPSHAVLLDIIGELANMLLGRIKMLLADRGISVLLSTPTASVCEKLRLSAPPTEGAEWYAFTTLQGPVFARISLRIDPALVLASRPEHPAAPIAEGEMVML